jgi:hypothetical protein
MAGKQKEVEKNKKSGKSGKLLRIVFWFLGLASDLYVLFYALLALQIIAILLLKLNCGSVEVKRRI